MFQYRFLALFIFLLMQYNYCSSQNEAANWMFGKNFSLSFNSGIPETTNPDFSFATIIKPAIISDKNGCYQFYSSGGVIYGKDKELMPDGTGILGIGGAGIIIPKPGSDTIYYYIYTRCYNFCDDLVPETGTYYSIINMSLNNGNGDVVLKNVKFSDYAPQSFEAVRDPNSNNIWLVTYINPEKEIRAYKFTEQGFNLNYVTSTINAQYFGQGYFSRINFSNDGTKLAVITYNNGLVGGQEVSLFDFDTNTGIVSDQLSLGGIASLIRFVEFSPNGNLLYFVTGENILTDFVYQMDISLNSVNEMLSSLAEIHSVTPIADAGENNPNQGGLGDIRLGPDGKLYILRTSNVDNYLDVIHNPNETGTACNYEEQGFFAEENQTQIYGQSLFPSFVRPYNIDLSIDVEDICAGLSRNYNINSTYDIISVTWDFGDGTASNEISPTHTYSSAGIYILTVVINTTNETRTLTKRIEVYDYPLLGEVTDYHVCDDESNDGFALFDLITKTEEILNGQSSETFDVLYYSSIEDLENYTNVINVLNYINETNNQTVYAKVYNKENLRCYDVVEFNLVVDQMPILNSIDDVFFACGDINEESRLINLFQFNDVFLSNQLESDFNFKYYLSEEDAENNSNSLSFNFEMEADEQTFYVRVENSNNNDCFDIISFDVVFENRPIAYQPEDLFVCDLYNDIDEQINLTVQNEQVLNGQPSETTKITYHASASHADLGEFSLPNSYIITSIEDRIYVRIESVNNEDCYDITFFDINLLSVPELGEDEVFYICPNEEIVLEVNDTYDSYLWSSGDMSNSIFVNEPGNYTVVVSKNNLTTNGNQLTCDATKTFTIIESDTPETITIEVNDLSSNNSIEVFAYGQGDYEYSLDEINYQQHSTFENLRDSEYEVYIRDRNGCGVVIENVKLIISPRYFTPNGDGINDYWRLKSSFFEPNLEIQIFNRYGKLLFEFKGNDIGWNGRLNGQKLPTSDYWYKIFRPSNGKTYLGHFTLKN